MKKTKTKNPVARKKGGKKCEPVAKVETPQKDKYTLMMKMGALEYEVTGNDETMFVSLKPEKITTKCVFILTNNENNKSYERALPPLFARKLVVSSLVQKIQWKIMSGKVS